MCLAIISCIVGLLGYQSSRDKRIIQDSKWQEGITKEIQYVAEGIDKITGDIKKIKETLACHDKRISFLEKEMDQEVTNHARKRS